MTQYSGSHRSDMRREVCVQPRGQFNLSSLSLQNNFARELSYFTGKEGRRRFCRLHVYSMALRRMQVENVYLELGKILVCLCVLLMRNRSSQTDQKEDFLWHILGRPSCSTDEMGPGTGGLQLDEISYSKPTPNLSWQMKQNEK